jgi:hypothetical protein
MSRFDFRPGDRIYHTEYKKYYTLNQLDRDGWWGLKEFKGNGRHNPLFFIPAEIHDSPLMNALKEE